MISRMTKGTRVMVAMSGGVDSSVAAMMLKEAGYDVVGVTMRLWFDPHAEAEAVDQHKGCCSMAAIEDARKLAAMLDIPHYVLNMQDAFYENIVRRFTDEYLQGRTPNPCIECNRSIKFASLLNRAQALGIDYLATGHYARIIYNPASGLYRLLKGKDQQKDQSYMLYVLKQKDLPHIIFPLGEMTKQQVRLTAKEKHLNTADQEESQEICFIPDNDYRSFMQRHFPEVISPGDIVTTSGSKVGRHRGIAFYTVGQRKGLGLTSTEPLFVVHIDAGKNLVVVGKREETYSEGLIAGNLNYLSGITQNQQLEVAVKVRYRSSAVPAVLFPQVKGRVRVIFHKAQQAVTPGQSAVFYQGDEVIGGGIIEGSI